MKRVAFTGGRNYLNVTFVRTILELLCEVADIEVHVGDCQTGADNYVRQWCFDCLPSDRTVVHKAHWDVLGKAAGPMRNSKVVENADLLVAFAGDKGTQDCIEKARARNIPVFVVSK